MIMILMLAEQDRHQAQILLGINCNNMSAFKKKKQIPESVSDFAQKLNMLLSLGSQTNAQLAHNPPKTGKITLDLIIGCASFWDSKQRIDKIKSLLLKDLQLQEFNDTQDFKVHELMSIELLSLSTNKIMHLQPLSSLDTLVCLNINNNKVYDLSPLAELIKLEQLYAANNQITNIDALKNLTALRILNLYSNKITRLKETVKILQQLSQLEQLDIEENPIYSKENREQFLALQKLLRLNGELILQQQRQQERCMFPTAKFRDTHTSFFNPNKSQVSQVKTAISNTSSQKLSRNELIAKRNQLQIEYFELDDKFEEEIVRNVQLKSEYHQKILEKKERERRKEQMREKQQEVKQLKRKVKAMKENLFSKANSSEEYDENQPDPEIRKAKLLRELFQLDMMAAFTEDKNAKKSVAKLWVRKFDYDDEIIVENHNSHREVDDDQYLLEEEPIDQQIEMLLSNNTSAIQQLKKQLREIAN